MDVWFCKFPLIDSMGGAEKHTLLLANHFSSIGDRIKLVSSDKKLLNLFWTNGLSAEYRFAGWEPTSGVSLLLWPLTILFAKPVFWSIAKKTTRDSVFFLQSLTEKLLLSPMLIKKGGRVFWLEHKIPGRWLKLNPLLKKYLRLSKKVQLVTVSKFAHKEFVKIGGSPKNIQYIYPGVSVPKNNTAQPTVFTIGILSRLDPEKGVLSFLNRFLSTLKKNPGWQMIIAGEGKEGLLIKKTILAHRLSDRVRCLGFINDLTGFFSKISVLVYPSLVPESFGLAALESIANKVPVIAPDAGAISEIIQHGKTGFLVPLDSKEGWERCVEAVSSGKVSKEMGERGWFVAQSFSEKS